MSIEYDEKEKTFSQTELIPMVQSVLINPTMSMSDILSGAQNSPTLLPDTPTVTPNISDDAGVQILSDKKFQSPNFATGFTGWNIESDGSVEFNNGTFRGRFVLGGVIITINKIGDLQSAIDSVNAVGGGIVNLEPGTYNASSSFTYSSNVTVDGNGAAIDFGGTANNFSATGTNPYSTGTLSVNFNSGSVTGSGTTWTAGMIGQSILIGDYWYTITARSSNTAITISPVFRAPSVSGVTYVIATTVDGIGILNLTLQNNITVPLFDYRYVNGIVQDGLFCTISPQGVRGRDSANMNYLNSSCQTCTAGMILNNLPFIVINNSGFIDISGGIGLDITGVTNSTIGTFSIQNVVGIGMKITSCSNLSLVNYSIIECTSYGIEFVSNNNDIDSAEGYVNTCGGDCIKLTASSNRCTIVATSLLNSTGYGINIASSTCNDNKIIAPAFSNNTAGNINDSGTGTFISPQTLSSFIVQDIALSAGTETPNGLISTSDSTGMVLFIAWQDSASNTVLRIARLIKDTVTSNYKITHTATLTVSANGYQGLAVVGSFLYVNCLIAATGACRRYSTTDLSGVTTMTISGTNVFGNQPNMWSDITNLFVLSSSGNYDKYTISGTTVTWNSTVAFTSAGIATKAVSDGVNMWCSDTEFTTTTTIRKYAITGGAVVSTTTLTPKSNAWVNGGSGGGATTGCGLFLGSSTILSLIWNFNICSDTAKTGLMTHLTGIALP